MFCRSLFVLLSFSVLAIVLYLFDLRILITPLVSSISFFLQNQPKTFEIGGVESKVDLGGVGSKIVIL
jgi:hypothetical protein